MMGWYPCESVPVLLCALSFLCMYLENITLKAACFQLALPVSCHPRGPGCVLSVLVFECYWGLTGKLAADAAFDCDC